MPEMTVWVVSGLTGEKFLNLTSYLSSAQWERRLSDVGSGTHVFAHQLLTSGPRVGAILKRQQWRDRAYPHRNMIVQCWGDRVVYAGYVNSITVDETSVTFRSLEFRSLLSWRMPFQMNEPDYLGATLNLTSSIEGLIVETVRKGVYRPSDPFWNAPVVLPSYPGGSETLLVEYWRAKTIEDIVRSIEQREAGPDVDFEPEWNPADDRFLQFVLRVGVPRLDGQMFEFAPGSPKSGLTGWSTQLDGSEQLTGGFMAGEGSEVDMMVGFGILGSPTGIPYRDGQSSVKDVSEQDQLDSRAQGFVLGRYLPLEQLNVSYLATGHQGIPRLGDVHRMVYTNHFWEFDGPRDYYTVGMRGTHELGVTPDLQPLGALV